jgi:CBS domain-containing protein
MDTRFYTLTPDASISEAMKIFKRAIEERRQKVFLMVTDPGGRLVGMLSMYDILLLVRPKHIHIWGEMEDIEIKGLLDEACRKARSILVSDIMSTDVITITPETHLLMVVDTMIRKHIRRLPVIEKGKVVGIVYISDIFYQIVERLTD